MRRLLLVFLAILLPIQFAWAGAAAYCAHEERTPANGASWHIGHHSHVHPGADAHQDAAKPAPKLPDADCAACHFPGSHGVIAQAILPGSYHFVTVRYLPRVAGFGSIPASVPDRPQWSRPA